VKDRRCARRSAARPTAAACAAAPRPAAAAHDDLWRSAGAVVPPRAAAAARDERGQALLLLVAAACGVLIAALVLGAIARGIGAQGRNQRAADLAALAGARAMRATFDRLLAPPAIEGRRNPLHLDRAAFLAHARERALGTAQLNGASRVGVSFPREPAPTRIRVTVSDPAVVEIAGQRRSSPIVAVAEAEIAPGSTLAASSAAGDYRGPLVLRQGKPMRPDVALAFDRLAAAARRDGISLLIVSAFRSSAEQARLFAANPDPRWVAPPGRSLHRLGTELDLGPASAYGWLAANASRFHFVRRYSWEPWHYEVLLPYYLMGREIIPWERKNDRLVDVLRS